MSKHVFIPFLIVLSCLTSKAQDNLVPNGNFEEVETCVSNGFNYYVSKNWFSPQDKPFPLENTCFYGNWWSAQDNVYGLKNSKCGYFETYGYFTQLVSISHHRAYLAVKLKQTLVAEQQYYFEMSFRTLDTVPDVGWIVTDFSDGQDIAFTNEFPTYNWSIPNSAIELQPVLSNTIVKDYKWHKLKGCFKAKGGEQYLLIGNFRTNAQMKREPTGKQSKTQFVSSCHVVDDVVLTPVKVTLRDTAVCQGEKITLNVQHKYLDSLQYRWHDGTTTPQYNANKTEKISVEITYLDNNCVARADMSFKTLETTYRPTIQDSTICRNEKVVFKAGTGLEGETIKWKNGSKDRFFTANTEGVYWAEIKNRCASWVDTFRLRIKNCDLEAFVPTAFSPNGDGFNDDFHPFFKADYLVKVETYDLQIFNRWGNLVFSSKNETGTWDGTYKGVNCETGLYIWTLSVRLVLNGKTEMRQLSGDVSLMR